MGISFVHSVREAFLKLLSNLTSYKLWILTAGTWALAEDYISEWFWFGLAVLIISERAFEKFLGLGFFGRVSGARVVATGESAPVSSAPEPVPAEGER
jgi:hypothetical protein